MTGRMCGIAGVFGPNGGNAALLEAMGGSLFHRGPDDGGVWSDPAAQIGFAHRRLAVVDLSPLGHQPMVSESGRWVLSYNGEIYNHYTLRAELEAAGLQPEGGWRGHSDTETLVAAIAAWGLEAALQRATGMFALALWDRDERRLHLARDRFGEKPLYYGRVGRDFLFASELKAIRVHPEFSGEVDRDALASYAALSVIPAPQSIYRGLSKLMPGSILTIAAPGAVPAIAPYWSYRDVVLDGLVHPIRDERQALDELDAALRVAIAGQAVADVPVGAFLSGGIDSSTIVALYQAVSGSAVRTYTIGFDEAGYDESHDARTVASHLGTIHHDHRVGVKEARDIIPLLPTVYDEPFADSSQIPTYLVSRFARGEVTVAISGDGGDELFAGYNRHRVAPAMWGRMQRLPTPLRRLAGHIPPSAFTLLAKLGGERRAGLGVKAAKAARIMAGTQNLDDVYDSFLDEWYGLGSPVLGGNARARQHALAGDIPDIVRVTYADAVGYLPDDILAKVDRAAMAVSLETRVPFLDHQVAAVAARIDPALKVRGGKGKYILRQLLGRHVPHAFFERPKAGFAVPVGEWIRGPLRDWAEGLLSHERLEREGYWDSQAVRRRWEGHLDGRTATPAIWSVLMFQAWLDQQAR
jgi:asparagine synthase (glutamine-hydrolysing)